MENSQKEKIHTEDVTVKEDVVEEVTKTEIETPDGKTIETKTVYVIEVVSAEVDSSIDSGTKTVEAVAADQEMIETKEEVVTTSDGTVVEEKEAEKPTLVSDQVLANGVSEGAEVAAEKSEAVAAATVVSDSAPKKLEEAVLPTSETNVGKSSGVADSVSKENTASKGGDSNQEKSEIPRSTENQQFVAATPRTQTSWTNCCGLWDFLKRSN